MKRFSFLLACLPVLHLIATAVTNDWTGAADQDWFNQENWSDPFRVPGTAGSEGVIARFGATTGNLTIKLDDEIHLTEGAIFHDNYTISSGSSRSRIRFKGGSFDAPIDLNVSSSSFISINPIIRVPFELEKLSTMTITSENTGNLNIESLVRIFSYSSLTLGSGITLAIADPHNELRCDMANFIVENQSGVAISSKLTQFLNGSTLQVNDGGYFISNSSGIRFVDSTITIQGTGLVQLNPVNPIASIHMTGLTLDLTSGTLQLEGSSGSTFTQSVVTVDGGTLDCSNSDLTIFQNSTVNIVKETALFNEINLSFSSKMNLQDSKALNITSRLQISDSQVSVHGQFSPSYKIDFVLDDSSINQPYFTISEELSLNNKNTVDGSHVSKGGTFILFTAKEISPNFQRSITLPSATSLVHFHGAQLLASDNSTQSIIVTANKHPTSAHATLGSLTGGQPLSTISRINNMQESHMKAGSGTISSDLVSIQNARSGYLAQNSELLTQATPVEQLGERAIEGLKQWSVYVAPTGSLGSIRTKRGQTGSSFYSAGFLTGFDFASSYIHDPEKDFAFGIGSTFYYSHFHLKIKEGEGSTDVDQMYANIYGTLISKHLEELSLDFALGAGYDLHHNQRTTGHFGSLVARSSPHGFEAGGFVGLEYLFDKCQFPRMGNCRFIPIAFLQYAWVSLDDYKEHGAGEFNLKVHADSLHSLRTFLGARLNCVLRAGQEVTVRPEITLGWQREYLGDDQKAVFITFAAPAPESSTMLTIAPNRNTLLAGADVYIRMYDWTSLQFNYLVNKNNLITNHSFFIEWKVEF